MGNSKNKVIVEYFLKRVFRATDVHFTHICNPKNNVVWSKYQIVEYLSSIRKWTSAHRKFPSVWQLPSRQGALCRKCHKFATFLIFLHSCQALRPQMILHFSQIVCRSVISIQRRVGLIHCLMLIKKVTDVFWCFKRLLLLRSKGNAWPSDHASFVVFREEPIIRYWKYNRLLNAWSWEALQALIKDTCSQMGRARLTEDITKIFLVCSMGVVKAPQNSLNMNVIWHISWFLRHLADPKCGTLIG